MNKKNYKNGFERGMEQVRKGDLSTVKKQLLEALKVKDPSTLWGYTVGRYEPKASVAQDIENVFKKFDIVDVWGKSKNTKKS